MMKELVIYRCEICGNLIIMVENSGMVPYCCGQSMTHLEANTTDGAIEKHVPIISQRGTDVLVSIGSTSHPMINDHYIMWVILLTNKGAYARKLLPGNNSKVHFSISLDEDITGAYAYCNIHGLWKHMI